ncbi:MAG: FAD-dependent oxidoreductase [Gemmatimonadota bacterium]
MHGGVRYLQQGNVARVIEALKDRGLLLANAPHLVHDLRFVVPNYEWWEHPFYGIGLKVYDMLAGRHGFGKSKMLSREDALALIPTLERDGLIGGVVYYDGQFDDARLAINLAQTAAEQGAVVANYVRVTDLLEDGGTIAGVVARDVETGREWRVRSRVVVNATGAWTDALRRLDAPEAAPIIRPSQGVHLVLPARFLPGDSAIMVPRTDDGRVLFAIPWRGRVVVGTTDTPVDAVEVEPKPFQEEVDFLLEHAARYLEEDPSPSDILSIFAGIRPLVAGGDGADTASLSRDHTLLIADSGLVTIAGGKWTTYRKMAQDTVDQAATIGQLEDRACVTERLQIHGHHAHADRFGDLAHYGSDAPEIRELLAEAPERGEPVHPGLAVRVGEVVWAARHEMARTVDDVLARRTRSLLLDARAAMEAAPRVAGLLAAELGRDDDWRAAQVASFTSLARGYLP